ncbi:hypothetical protein Tco_1194346 [Tanacetum coccineum]
MAALESCPKHNMVAYLEKTEGNTEFHEIIDFLSRSSIHYALTVSPVTSTTFIEQFWTSAKSQTINDVRHIKAKVAGKPFTVSEASIRSSLLFDDVDGIDSLNNPAIFDAIQQMGYEGDLTVLTFNKALFSPQWKFFFHTMNHCISSKSTSWDQIPTNIATAVICLSTNQKYNFSKLIFDGMLRHLDAKKKFVMYPRFISIFLDKQLKNVSVPLDHFPINALTCKVFSFMVKKGKHFSGNVTPLFPSMLVQPIEDEGKGLDRPSVPQPTPSPIHTSEAPVEPQHDPSTQPSPQPSPSPSHQMSGPHETIPDLPSRPTPTIPDTIPQDATGNVGDQSSNDRSLSGSEDGLTLQSLRDLCISLCEQGRKSTKGEPSVPTDPAFDAFKDLNNMETEAYPKFGVCTDLHLGTDRDNECTNFQTVSTDRPREGTDTEKVSTDSTKLSTDKVKEDDETIAQVLLNMSQAKAVSREKEKGIELKDVENVERQRVDDISIAEKTFQQLANDEEIARKMQEYWEADEERKRLAKEEATKDAFIQEFDDIKARIEADRQLAERIQAEERERERAIHY